jgi:transglutaminase-like putative cysteine protease
VIQVLKEDAVERWAEFSFSYEPRHERLTVNWVRVVKPDGTVLSDKPGIAQDADVPAPMNDPVYVEQKVRRLSLANVRPGTLVDYSYTVEELKPFRAGDFFAPWRVNPGTLVRRSRLMLDTPATLVPRVVEQNLTFRPTTVTANGRRVVTWAAQDVPRIEPEPFAADSNGVDMRIDVGAPAAWREIGAWYAGLARDRYAMTPALERKLASLVAGARTQDDSIKAVHRYVTRDVRYVAISLRMGGYQPHAASEVVATGYGDCKDKATLFIALMRRMGITAFPVLLSAGGRVERALPTISAFNHAIAAVERPAGRLFVDLTASDVPWGSLPEPDQGQFVLVIRPDGRTEETITPENDQSEIHNRVTIVGSLDTAGFAGARVDMIMDGALGDAYHSILVNSPPDSASRAQFLRRLASGIYPESEGDSLQFSDETDRGGEFRIGFVARGGRAAQLAGPVAVLALPFLRRLGDVKPLVAELQAHRPRRFPIDVAEVAGASGGNGESRLQLELPAGWQAELPKDVALAGAFGEVKLTYAQAGRVLTVTERRVGRRGVLPPDRLDDLVAWLEQVSAATRESASIVLRRGP